MDIKAAFVLLICVPLIPMSIVLVQKFAKRLLNRYWGQYTKLGDNFLENLQGLTTLKIYEADGHYHEKMNVESENFRKITMRVLTMQLNSITVMDLVAYGGSALGIVFALNGYHSGAITMFQTLFIILISAEFFIPMRQLGSYFHIAMNGMAASDKLFAILEKEIEEKQNVEIEDCFISASNLHFGYMDQEVLHGLNFKAHNGMIGFVGESGSGKSTIASLLMGQYSNYRGELKLSNYEIKDINIYPYMTLVSLESYLFSGTLKDNLSVAKDASEKEMNSVLEKVGILDFVHEQGGLNMHILEGGKNLSGGQRQRLVLARALLKDSPIYIMDEATSNIDVESENKIMEVLYELSKEKLVFPLTGFMICAILMGVAGFLCAIFIPVLSSMALVNDPLFSFHTIVILLFVCALLRGILRYAEQACNHYIAFKLLARIRDQVFGALRKLCPAKLEVKDKGSLISLITSDIELLEVFYAHTISPICIAFVTSLICVGIQVQFGWIYGLYSLFVYVVVGVVLPIYISKQSRQIGVEYRKEAANLNSYVLESMRGLKESMQYMDTDRRLSGLNKQTSSLANCEKELKYFQAKTISLTNFCVVLLSLGLCLIHIYMNSSIDSMIVSGVLQISSFGPVIALANLGSTLSQTIGAGQRVISLLDESPMVEEVENKEETDFKMVDVSSVDFAYEEEQILKDMNLNIRENEVIGIQGKSGSGKSTLLKLLMRFWNVSKGSILVDGLNIRSLNTSNLRKNEGYVTQETILFHDTIENNLRVAKQNATMEEIEVACKKANIHEYIQSLPNGYKTMVEELGSSLSGGERQRIGLARMFLHDAKLVLLDEPTSNLDSLNEGAILKSIYEERKDKTIVFVSHRESTLSHCDRVIHMESERVS